MCILIRIYVRIKRDFYDIKESHLNIWCQQFFFSFSQPCFTAIKLLLKQSYKKKSSYIFDYIAYKLRLLNKKKTDRYIYWSLIIACNRADL